MSILVPNTFPEFNTNSRIAVIGEAPGVDEENHVNARGQLEPKPFVGASGRLLRAILGSHKVAAEQCYLGNISQFRPPDGKIENFDWEGVEIQGGIQQLKEDFTKYDPHVVLALGRSAFRAFKPESCYYEDGEIQVPLSDWRGSVFRSTTFGTKTIASYHPAYVLRDYGQLPILKFDILRTVNNSQTREIVVRQRSFPIYPTCAEVVTTLARMRANKRRVAFDVEGQNDNVGITMVSFFDSPTTGIVIPLWLRGTHYYTLDEEVQVWEAIAGLLGDPEVPKIVQSAMYECFIFAWKHSLIINNIAEDTMLKHAELFPEFDKNLGFQTSIYTDEPYYKDQRTSSDVTVSLNYNGKDSAVTFECCDAQEMLLRQQPRSNEHYRFNISLLPALNYLHLRGCRLSPERIEENIQKTVKEIERLGGSANLIKKTKKNEESLTGGELGELVGRPINAKSTEDKQWLLYDFLGYTPYTLYGKSTKEIVLHKYYTRDRNPAVKLLIQLVSVRTRKSDIEKLTTNEDGRIRSNYNLAGTSTARLNSTESNALVAYFTKTGILKWDHTGTNLQNVTKELRECFMADEGNDFWNYDLSGADAWTVAADLAALGHSTMLDDLLAGIKPAKVLLLMLEEYEAGRNPASINNLDRQELARRTKAISFPDGRDSLGRQGDWKYLCMKRCQHGTNYDMQADTLSETIFKDSDGTIDLTKKEAGIYQYLYRLRYNPDARKQYIEGELRNKGIIRTATGFQRKFYGIRYGAKLDNGIIREALAFEPQVVTTYMTNMALRNLWYDTANRTSKGGLFIEPILQVHDALSGQWGQRYRQWAIERTKAYFNNRLVIHGIDIQIPAEGNYGPDWGHCKQPV